MTVVMRFGEAVAGGVASAFEEPPTRLPIILTPTVLPKPLREMDDFMAYTPPLEMWNASPLGEFLVSPNARPCGYAAITK
jgi:hypothetical protein